MTERNRAGGGRLENVSGPLLVRRFSVRQPEMFRVVETVSAARLTSIDKAALCELAQTVMDLEYEGLGGDFLQAGCGLGGAAIVIAHAKRRNRAFSVHDPFCGEDAESRVKQALAAHGADERLSVRLVPGPYDETLERDGALAFVHVDVGTYDATRLLLERLTPRLVSGGRIILDDYHFKEDCKRAVDDHFRCKSGFRLVRKNRLHAVRN